MTCAKWRYEFRIIARMEDSDIVRVTLHLLGLLKDCSNQKGRQATGTACPSSSLPATLVLERSAGENRRSSAGRKAGTCPLSMEKVSRGFVRFRGLVPGIVALSPAEASAETR